MTSQVLPAPHNPPVERPIADCRVYPRSECSVPTTCQPASVVEMKEMRWPATISDISIGGIRLLLQRRFEKGSALAIELPGDGVREPTVVFVKVMHVRSAGNGAWMLGCKFVSELSDDELQRLLTSTQHVLSTEKPPEDEPEPAETDADATANTQPESRVLQNVFLHVETVSGRTMDFVIKKLNVSRIWPLAPGKILAFRGKSADQSSWSVRVQVTGFHEQSNGWEITGKVIGRSPGTDEMRALVELT
ncbi:MAG: PilZ domain-containing protein [Planctomycetes bacterium]|nr:PilZ domain-containing protein [Planctomycetota bacterium]